LCLCSNMSVCTSGLIEEVKVKLQAQRYVL